MHNKSTPDANSVTATAVCEIGQKVHVVNPTVDGSNGFFEPVQTVSMQMEERPRTRIAAKAGQRMGIPTRQRTAPTAGPAYQVYQITPEQSAALLQRFWS